MKQEHWVFVIYHTFMTFITSKYTGPIQVLHCMSICNESTTLRCRLKYLSNSCKTFEEDIDIQLCDNPCIGIWYANWTGTSQFNNSGCRLSLKEMVLHNWVSLAIIDVSMFYESIYKHNAKNCMIIIHNWNLATQWAIVFMLDVLAPYHHA